MEDRGAAGVGTGRFANGVGAIVGGKAREQLLARIAASISKKIRGDVLVFIFCCSLLK